MIGWLIEQVKESAVDLDFLNRVARANPAVDVNMATIRVTSKQKVNMQVFKLIEKSV